MRILLHFKITILIFICCTLIPTYSQNLLNPAEVQPPTSHSNYGLFFGLGMNYQSGTYSTSGCKCEFNNGKGKDYLFGALFEKEVLNSVDLGIALGFNFKSLISSYISIENLDFTMNNTGIKESVRLHFRYKAESNFTYLPVIPYLKWQPVEIIFFRLGLNASVLLYSNLKHTKEMIDTSAMLSNGERISVSFSDGSNVLILENNKFKDIKSIIFFLEPSLGFNINIYKNIIFSPVFQSSLPLTKIDNSTDKFKLLNWKIIMEFRYEY
ncbi:MAG: hypothetical protein ABSG15_12630 [FCB group bacterium]|jgi:hypothetical protein